MTRSGSPAASILPIIGQRPIRSSRTRTARRVLRKRISLPASAASSNIPTGLPGAPLPENSGRPTIPPSACMQRWQRSSAGRAKRSGWRAQRPPGSCRQAGAGQAADRKLDQRTGFRRARCADGRASASSSPFSTAAMSRPSASPSSSPCVVLARTTFWPPSSAASAMTGRRNSKRPAARSSG